MRKLRRQYVTDQWGAITTKLPKWQWSDELQRRRQAIKVKGQAIKVKDLLKMYWPPEEAGYNNCKEK